MVPANFASFLFLHTQTGIWVALLGAGAILINVVIICINGGFSRVLAIPHVLLWIPLQIILVKQIPGLEMASMEHALCMAVMIINGISLLFDLPDTWRWYHGERAIIGFKDHKVKL